MVVGRTCPSAADLNWPEPNFRVTPEEWAWAFPPTVRPWRIRPTKLIVAPAMMHLAKEVLLRAEAISAPLHRLRYRWSLRRRAPAWKRRRLHERNTLRAFDKLGLPDTYDGPA